MLSRRNFLKLGTAAAATTTLVESEEALAQTSEPLAKGGADYSYLTGTEREGIATACALCASRCPAIGYVERGYVVKIEGQPRSIRTRGRLCAKGQAGINQIYDPDRILHPLRRTGKRGEGKWEKISWDAALGELADRLKKLRDDGHPEKFMFHHGWISASAKKLINDVFLATYGTGSIAGNSCFGQSARKTAQELTWGGGEDSWDFDNTRFVLNFGSNVLEAHTNHVALSLRLADGLADRNLKMITFDVRLSNTGAKSHSWIQIRPGTDLAVVLAMCNVVMNDELYRGVGEEFLKFCRVTSDRNASTADKIAALKAGFADHTPEWAEEISGVSADIIRDVATQFATTSPACVISSRGASANHNGVETERAIQILAAITGNIDNPGGRCRGVTAPWNTPPGPDDKPEPRALDILNGFDGDAALPVHGLGHRVLKLIEDGGKGRPDVYMWYNYNPAFSNGNGPENSAILKNESLIPFTVAVTPFYDESAALADLILPDATYLERFDFEDAISPSQVPEYYLRQPVVPPRGEARDFKDVCCELAVRMGFPLGFTSGEDFIEQSGKLTPDVRRKAGGLRKLKSHGVWHDPEAEPRYHSYATPVEAAALQEDGVILDDGTGVYWNWMTAGASGESEALSKGYLGIANAYKGYVGQEIDGRVYAGFTPDRFNKTGYFEIYSTILEDKGLAPLPTYSSIPEHQNMQPDDLVLTTFRINVQTLSTTQNAMWLNEIDVDQSAWINPATASSRGIVDGERIKIKSRIGEIEVSSKVTENVVPGVVAISSHGGRWEYGRYASGKRAPHSVEIDTPNEELKWWTNDGAYLNQIIPISSEPISGQQRWMDTVVSISKA
jgi:thiosulfate reductase/polysulfide reductase chain A